MLSSIRSSEANFLICALYFCVYLTAHVVMHCGVSCESQRPTQQPPSDLLRPFNRILLSKVDSFYVTDADAAAANRRR
jgi:hypothetical protein